MTAAHNINFIMTYTHIHMHIMLTVVKVDTRYDKERFLFHRQSFSLTSHTVVY